jgi:hypothetical protein
MLRRFERFWEQDRGLTILLLLLILAILAGGPSDKQGALSRFLLSLLFTLILGAGVLVVSRRRWAGLVAGGVAAAAVVMEWIRQWSPTPALEVTAALSAFACVSILAAVVLIQVLRAGRITLHRIVGSTAAYLLLGFAWGELYRALSAAVPGAFAAASGALLEHAHYQYFSIVTLTTLGYGDITPVHPFARSLAMLEALTGQLFPAILIARLVSMELVVRDRRHD